MVLQNRYEVMALVEARMCNPNGDPDMNNLPRMDFATNQGVITDVAFKARMREYVKEAYGEEDGLDILMVPCADLNKAIASASIQANGDVIAKGKNVENAAKLMCERYWDVRTFGGVLSTGLNAGQVRGAVQVGMALSVDSIEPQTSTITRRCYVSDVDAEKCKTKDEAMMKFEENAQKLADDKKRTMGTKTYIPYGLYVLKLTVSANLAEKVGFTEDDFKILLESVMQMYEIGFSSSKMGMAVLSPIVVFKHVGTNPSNPQSLAREAKLGCAPAYKLFDLLTIQRKKDVDVARSYQDYDIVFHLDELPAGVECGLKKVPYADIEWVSVRESVDLFQL